MKRFVCFGTYYCFDISSYSVSHYQEWLWFQQLAWSFPKTFWLQKATCCKLIFSSLTKLEFLQESALSLGMPGGSQDRWSLASLSGWLRHSSLDVAQIPSLQKYSTQNIMVHSQRMLTPHQINITLNHAVFIKIMPQAHTGCCEKESFLHLFLGT